MSKECEVYLYDSYYTDILGHPKYIGELRIVETSPLPSRPAKSTNEYIAIRRRTYLKSTKYGTWMELLEYEVEEILRKGYFFT